jgi:regulator of cell morphogenesis and NO signaling
MPTAPTAPVAALIAHILERFHETHRRELPQILALARAVEARGGPAGLAQRLAATGRALEDHMFKEEMRLFPMMEQGGSPLIGLLIDDMRGEHRAHEQEIARVQALMSGLTAPAEVRAEAAALRAAVAKLLDDLAQHIAAEDDDLFLRFAPPQR